jgi:feruloyl esterase
MPHGPGGVAPDRFDLLSDLVNWVERAEPPGPVIAAVREDNENAPAALRGAGRKLCIWPSVARFAGTDPASANSFTCVSPD